MVNQVNIPEGLDWNTPSRQRIIRINNNIGSKAELFDRLGSLLKRQQISPRTEIVIELPEPSILEKLRNGRWHGPKIRVRVSDDNLAEIHKDRALLNAFRPALVLNQCKGSLPRTIQFLASLYLPIEVSPNVFIDQKKETYLDLADRLLFSPFMKTPIQPFFNLLLYAMENNTRILSTLWDTCNESIGQSFYVTKDGKVTLSACWSEKQRYFGTISDTINTLRNSQFFREIYSIKNSSLSENAKCHKCPIERFCSGYLYAFDPTYDCTAFLSLHDFMHSHSNSLKESYISLPNHKKRDVLRAIAIPVQSDKQ